MGFDEMKDKAGDLAREHGDKVKEGADKAGDFVDDKTGGKFGEHIGSAQDKVGDFVDDLGEGGDAPEGEQQATDRDEDTSEDRQDSDEGLFGKAKDFFRGDR